MNKKKLGVFVSATLGLISCVCVLPKISVYAQGNFMRVFTQLGTRKRYGFVKMNKDGSSLVKLRLPAGNHHLPASRRLDIKPGDEIYRMKSNGGGYGFEDLRTIRGNNDVQLDTGDGLAIYTTSKDGIKKLCKIVPNTDGVKVLTHKEIVEGGEKVAIYKLKYSSNGSPAMLEKHLLTVDRSSLTASVDKIKINLETEDFTRIFKLRNGVDPDKLVFEALHIPLD